MKDKELIINFEDMKSNMNVIKDNNTTNKNVIDTDFVDMENRFNLAYKEFDNCRLSLIKIENDIRDMLV